MCLKGIDFSEFMNDHREFHAWVEGFCEVFCFWRPRYEPSKELLEELREEHHYYVFGRASGFICLVLFLVGIWKLIRDARSSRNESRR